MTTVEFRLPDLGEGLTESEIVTWHVAVGDTVTLNQPIADVETAKAVVELPSPHAGRIVALNAEPGVVVAVGQPIVTFEVPDAPGAGPSGSASLAGSASPGAIASGATASGAFTKGRGMEASGPNLVGYGAKAEAGARRRPRPALGRGEIANQRPAPADGQTQPAPGPAPATQPPAPGAVAPTRPDVRPRSTPPVRKLARELGVNLETLTGSGARGLITRADVQAAASAPPALPATPADARLTRTPVKGVRKHTAAAMVVSAFTAPHVTEFLTVDVTETIELIARLKAQRAWQGVKLTPLTLAAKAVCIALRHHPQLNTHWDEARHEIVEYHYVNLGIAAATPRGLTVPHVKDADRLSLRELADALAQLAETARAGKTAPADLSGGTFSITNVGVFGVDAGTPIINPGEAGILALGAVRRQPWEYRGEIALRQMLTLSLSFDHRLVDGEQGSLFLAEVGQILSDPASLISLL
ncbi:2-oxo acid dehydrogenase subunit E2 [Micrococcales bacterium 31B]|nr:2-oxo acid dehydrogenase subunit E2 [Micrococcales bacterium 31B]